MMKKLLVAAVGAASHRVATFYDPDVAADPAATTGHHTDRDTPTDRPTPTDAARIEDGST